MSTQPAPTWPLASRLARPTSGRHLDPDCRVGAVSSGDCRGFWRQGRHDGVQSPLGVRRFGSSTPPWSSMRATKLLSGCSVWIVRGRAVLVSCKMKGTAPWLQQGATRAASRITHKKTPPLRRRDGACAGLPEGPTESQRAEAGPRGQGDLKRSHSPPTPAGHGRRSEELALAARCRLA